MLYFLQNSWVIGIGGGLISGVIVFFVSNWIMSRKNNTEYVRQIQLANAEVINILKPYISDNGLPDKRVLDAIISSVSRKYKIKKDELYSITIFCEELIREIIGNVYVSNDKKSEHSRQLSEYINNLELSKTVNEAIDKSTEISVRSDYRQRLSKQYSILLSLTATMLTFFALVISVMEDKLNFLIYPFNESNIIIAVVGIITAASLVPLTAASLLRDILRIKAKKRPFKENEAENGGLCKEN